MTCPCNGGGRTRKNRRRQKRKGGSMVGDVILAGTALGLYSYFKKKGGSKKVMPLRKTRKAYV